MAGRRHNIEQEDKTRFIQTIMQAGLSKSEAKTLLSSLNTPKTPQELAQNIRDSRIKHFILTQTLLNYFLDEGHDSLDLTLVTHLSIGLKIPKDSYLRLYSDVKQVWEQHHNAFIAEAMGVSHSRVSPKLVRIIEKSVGENWHALLNEIKNTQVLTELFIKYSSTGSLSKEEYIMVKKQIFSLVKVIPSLAIFLLPGGAVLLPIFMKILPFSIVPDSFNHQTQNTPPPQINEAEPKNENETENHS